MQISVGDVMREVRNYFPHQRLDGTFEIIRGCLTPQEHLLPGDWVAIGGSRRNDGVYCLADGCMLPDARDERFEGTVWLLAPPPAFLSLCGEIAAWAATQGACHARRESFGAYSAEALTDAYGVPMTWQAVFASQLVPYRRMFTGVKLAC
ncbi:MAG: hypothetical protein Q4E72_03275 [bacterium]|nr:hypothetical protein [bacterium]